MFISLARSKYRTLELGVMNLQGAGNPGSCVLICPPFWKSVFVGWGVDTIWPQLRFQANSSKLLPFAALQKSVEGEKLLGGPKAETSLEETSQHKALPYHHVPGPSKFWEKRWTQKKIATGKSAEKFLHKTLKAWPVVPMLLPVKTCPLGPGGGSFPFCFLSLGVWLNVIHPNL